MHNISCFSAIQMPLCTFWTDENLHVQVPHQPLLELAQEARRTDSLAKTDRCARTASWRAVGFDNLSKGDVMHAAWKVQSAKAAADGLFGLSAIQVCFSFNSLK